MTINERHLRKKAGQLGYRLIRARCIRWEGTEFTRPYRLIECDTGFAMWPGFDDLKEVASFIASQAKPI